MTSDGTLGDFSPQNRVNDYPVEDGAEVIESIRRIADAPTAVEKLEEVDEMDMKPIERIEEIIDDQQTGNSPRH